MENSAPRKPKKSALQWNDEGLKLFDKRDFNEALTCFLAAAEIDPRDSSFAKNVGETYYRLGKIDKAISYYRRAIWLDSSRADYYNDIGIIYENSNQYRIALKFYQKAFEMDADHEDYAENVAKMLRKIGEYHQSLRAYHQMIKKDPRDPSLHNNMGIVYFSLQEYMPAYREFKLAQSINPENITYKQNMADALRHLEQFSESIELYKQIVEKTPTDDLSWNFLGLAYLQRHESNDFALAKKALKEAVNLVPDNANYWMSLGQAYRMSQNYLSAISAYKKAEQLQPDNYLILNNLGLCYYLKHDLLHAKQYMGKSLKAQPQDITLLENYIQILIELKDYEEAIPFFEAIRKLKSFDEFLKNAYGKCLSHIGRMGESLEYLQAAIEEDPLNHQYYMDLAETLHFYYQESTFTILLGDIERRDIKSAELYRAIAQIYVDQADLEIAYDFYEKAYHLDKNNDTSLREIIQCAHNIHRHNEVIYYATQFIDEFYPSLQILLFRAESYEALGNEELAQKDREEAKKLDPDLDLTETL